MIIVKCDSCGKEIDPAEGTHVIIDAYQQRGIDGDGEPIENSFLRKGGAQICWNCYGLVGKLFSLPYEDKEKLLNGENILATGNVSPIRKRKETKDFVDRAKIIELHKKGGPWNPENIARHLNMDLDTVCKTISEYKIKLKERVNNI
jgi:hypothetical protein